MRLRRLALVFLVLVDGWLVLRLAAAPPAPEPPQIRSVPVEETSWIPDEFDRITLSFGDASPTAQQVLDAIAMLSGWTIQLHDADDELPENLKRWNIYEWADGLTASEALELMMSHDASAPCEPLAYDFRDGRTIFVGHRNRVAQLTRRTVLYDVRAILRSARSREIASLQYEDNEPRTFFEAFTRSADDLPSVPSDGELAEELIDAITEFVDPDSWEAHGGLEAGMRWQSGGIIVVSAPPWIHEGVESMLLSLEREMTE